jgi:hypothetical protein
LTADAARNASSVSIFAPDLIIVMRVRFSPPQLPHDIVHLGNTRVFSDLIVLAICCRPLLRRVRIRHGNP